MPEGYEPAAEIVARPQQPRDATDVRIEYLADGGYVIAAPLFYPGGATSREIRVFDANDVFVGSYEISGFQSNSEIEVSGLPDGTFVVVTVEQKLATGTSGPTPGDVFWQHFDAQANPLSGRVQVSIDADTPSTPGTPARGAAQVQADVAISYDGTSYVVYQDNSSYSLAPPDIFLQRVAADGSLVGGPVQVNQTGAGSQTQPEIVAMPDGNLAVGWIEDGATDSVWLQLLRHDGSVYGNDRLIATGGSVSDLSIDSLGENTQVLVWQSDGDIFGRVISDGLFQSDAFVVSNSTAGLQDNPRVQAIDSGGFVVTWEDDSSGVDQIMARLFAADGTAGAEFAVAPDPASAQRFPDVARLANGDLEFTWSDDTGHVLRAIRYTYDAPPPPITGTNGPDALVGTTGDDVIMALAGDDLLTGRQGADRLDGGDGTDTASYDPDEGAVFVNLTLGMGYGNAAQGDTYISIENVVGTSYDDFLIGDPGVNRLDGGDGNDILIGAVGEDVLVGGNGTDTASYEDNSGTVFVDLLHRVGFNNAAQGDTYQGIENAIGGLFDDTLIGDDGDNRLDGAMGADTLVGNAGNDTFVFAYAPGASSPFGGANVDTLFDFLSGADKLEISSGAFGGGLAPGSLPDSAFVLGPQATDSADRFMYDQDAGKLWFDADGSGAGAAVLVALLPNHNTISADDFIIV